MLLQCQSGHLRMCDFRNLGPARWWRIRRCHPQLVRQSFDPELPHQRQFSWRFLFCYGGGLYFLACKDVTLANCVIAGHKAAYGAGIHWAHTSDPGTLTIDNCTIVDNAASVAGGGIYFTGYSYDDHLTVTGSVLWGNSDSGDVDEYAQVTASDCTRTVSFSCVQDEEPGDGDIPFGGAAAGNIDAPPDFSACRALG